MRKTEYRRLFKNVVGVNPTRKIKRRISVNSCYKSRNMKEKRRLNLPYL